MNNATSRSSTRPGISRTCCATTDVLAQEIADDLQTALEQFNAIAAELKR